MNRAPFEESAGRRLRLKITITDMVKNFENGLSLLEKWLRNKNTVEFLGIWEKINNPDLNSPEFEGIMLEAGLNRFTLSNEVTVGKPYDEKTPSLTNRLLRRSTHKSTEHRG